MSGPRTKRNQERIDRLSQSGWRCLLSQVNSIDRATAAAYATQSDFCRIFADDMSQLYLLAFLLTADSGKAERCFASALEECSSSSRVFREWARSWARRTVIQNAIRMAGPGSESERAVGRTESAAIIPGKEALAAVSQLKTLERFVYVMSVLEGIPDQDCAVLLRCRRQQVVDARLRALQHLAIPGGHKFARPEFTVGQLLAEPA
jgi:hypothetical protein